MKGNEMKKDTHPEYSAIVATCACGAQFKVGSTAKEIHVDICSSCHPFFTGKQKLVDTEGRVDKFRKRQEKAKEIKKAKVKK